MTTATQGKKWITRAAAAEVYSVSEDQLDKARAQGLIVAKRVGSRRVNLNVASLDSYFADLEDA